jgi:adenylosuccinate synthase
VARVILTAGLGFGDEGKGSTVDFLARHHKTDLVVRYNGGAQAGHNVITPDGRHHCFSQFGAGTFAGVQTYLSRYMLVNPITAFAEAKHLEALGESGAMSLLLVDPEALVTTPYHMALNRMKELSRGNKRHGSCGLGIGETVEFAVQNPKLALRVGDLYDTGTMARKLRVMRSYVMDWFVSEASWDKEKHETGLREFNLISDIQTRKETITGFLEFTKKVNMVDSDWFVKAFKGMDHIIFEGAQGVLLDENYGFFPYVTRSDCTFANALELLSPVIKDANIQRLGITRAYMTRHGAGPFLTEAKSFDVLSETDHNKTHDYQGAFRSGMFDLVATIYATEVLGIDGLVVNHLDRLRAFGTKIPFSMGYRIADLDTPWFDAYGHLTWPEKPESLETLARRTEYYRSSVAPYIVERSTDPVGYAHDLARALDVPLKILGEGPTANDKMPL